MNTEEIKRYLIELFPELTEKQAQMLAQTGDNISILITRVLDGNIDPPTTDIKDLWQGDSSGAASLEYRRAADGTHNVYFSSRLEEADSKQILQDNSIIQDRNISTRYNYPEVYEDITTIDMHVDVHGLRKRAGELNTEAAELYDKESRLCEQKRREARELNRRAVLVLMRRIVESGMVDLHGFAVEEAMMFMNDYYKFRKYEKIRIITGQEYNSKKIRPAVKEWLEMNGFEWEDEGASVIGIYKGRK